MITSEIRIRVRYSETDRMGYVHHGNYVTYFEMGRVELFREKGISYRDVEDGGILLPVYELKVKYMHPAFYDDLLTLKTMLIKASGVKLHFEYELRNEQNQDICKASVVLVFVNKDTRKPTQPPEEFLKLMHL
jgi:acyl-CoA thioester hydrolase